MKLPDVKSCVIIAINFQDGSWTNTLDNEVNSFVCETGRKPSSNAATNTQFIGCQPVGALLSILLFIFR